ncbi:MAG: hemerythrin domain-containing protein [Pseudomonadales bacterium]|nr:hemerythrin domain-containing protein [Pseudomonadales bacterium]
MMDRLTVDHRRLAFMLDVLETRLADSGELDADLLVLLDCLIDYIREYPQTVHHPREERITERLVDKGLTPGERVVVELTMTQHVDLSAATDKLGRDVTALLAREADAVPVFVTDVRRYLELQREHMRREEQQLFPLAMRLLTDADWNEVEAAEPNTTDPVYESRQDRYRALMDYVVDAHTAR